MFLFKLRELIILIHFKIVDAQLFTETDGHIKHSPETTQLFSGSAVTMFTLDVLDSAMFLCRPQSSAQLILMSL